MGNIFISYFLIYSQTDSAQFSFKTMLAAILDDSSLQENQEL